MKIKVCGMKYAENIASLGSCDHDLTGLIFYERSPRYMARDLSPQDLDGCRAGQECVGVFVDKPADEVRATAERYRLKWVQLHGDESPDVCRELREAGLTVVKAMPVESKEDIVKCDEYVSVIDYFLFDTRSKHRGGSGEKFNWDVLGAYDLKIPFFLSGGIGPEDARSVVKMDHSMLYGIDINSRFEVEPGRKDIELVKGFINAIRQNDGE